MVTVEQGHCTLAAVKRYWDTPCVGGRHNFFQRPLVTNRKTKHSWYIFHVEVAASLRASRVSVTCNMSRRLQLRLVHTNRRLGKSLWWKPITQKPDFSP